MRHQRMFHIMLGLVAAYLLVAVLFALFRSA